jgi:hypothetical protein
MSSGGSVINPINPKEQRATEAAMVSHAASQGFVVAVDPDLAMAMGAFQDDALDLQAADDSRLGAVAGDDGE